jgi:hypothetical protein
VLLFCCLSLLQTFCCFSIFALLGTHICFATFAQFVCYYCLCGSAMRPPARVSGEVCFATFQTIFLLHLHKIFATKHPATVPGISPEKSEVFFCCKVYGEMSGDVGFATVT